MARPEFAHAAEGHYHGERRMQLQPASAIVNEPRIYMRAEHVAKAAERLYQTVEVLQTKLAPVLKPEPPGSAVAGHGSIASLQSPLAASLEDLGDRLDTLVLRIELLADRIDV